MNADENGIGIEIELHIPAPTHDHMDIDRAVLMVWTTGIVRTTAFTEKIGELPRGDAARLQQILVIDICPTFMRVVP